MPGLTVLGTSINLPAGGGTGKVLTSDSAGVGTWQTPTGVDGSAFAFFMA